MARAKEGVRGETGDFNQNRLHRLLKLIRLLRTGSRPGIRELSQLLDTGERSVYRYLRLLESSGFILVKEEEGGYWIAGNEVSDTFTHEEAQLILKALEVAFPDRDEAHVIAAKLNVHAGGDSMANWIAEAGRMRVLGQISEAITNGRRILLKGYQSANSNSISDREVEPIQFTGEHAFLSAFEVVTACNKVYRIDRIAEVEVLEVPISRASEHRVQAPDVFGFALDLDASNYRIQLDMSLQAGLFLRSEAPLTAPYLVPHEATGRWRLDVVVADYRPTVRFVLPFLGSDGVRVLGDARFIDQVEQARKGVAG